MSKLAIIGLFMLGFALSMYRGLAAREFQIQMINSIPLPPTLAAKFPKKRLITHATHKMVFGAFRDGFFLIGLYAAMVTL